MKLIHIEPSPPNFVVVNSCYRARAGPIGGCQKGRPSPAPVCRLESALRDLRCLTFILPAPALAVCNWAAPLPGGLGPRPAGPGPAAAAAATPRRQLGAQVCIGRERATLTRGSDWPSAVTESYVTTVTVDSDPGPAASQCPGRGRHSPVPP